MGGRDERAPRRAFQAKAERSRRRSPPRDRRLRRRALADCADRLSPPAALAFPRRAGGDRTWSMWNSKYDGRPAGVTSADGRVRMMLNGRSVDARAVVEELLAALNGNGLASGGTSPGTPEFGGTSPDPAVVSSEGANGGGTSPGTPDSGGTSSEEPNGGEYGGYEEIGDGPLGGLFSPHRARPASRSLTSPRCGAILIAATRRAAIATAGGSSFGGNATRAAPPALARSLLRADHARQRGRLGRGQKTRRRQPAQHRRRLQRHRQSAAGRQAARLCRSSRFPTSATPSRWCANTPSARRPRPRSWSRR